MRILLEFVGLLFGSFFRWWWALITGVASILSFVIVRPDGITILSWQVCIIILVLSLAIFLTISAVWNAWKIYVGKVIRVIDFQKSDIYGSLYVVIIEVSGEINRGALLQVNGFSDGHQFPMALIEIKEKNAKGLFQANPVWMNPSQQQNLSERKIDLSNLHVVKTIDFEFLQGKRNDIKWKESA